MSWESFLHSRILVKHQFWVCNLPSTLQVSQECPPLHPLYQVESLDMTCVDLRRAGYPTMHFTSASNRRKVCTSGKVSKYILCLHTQCWETVIIFDHLPKIKCKLNLFHILLWGINLSTKHTPQRNRDCITVTITPRLQWCQSSSSVVGSCFLPLTTASFQPHHPRASNPTQLSTFTPFHRNPVYHLAW